MAGEICVWKRESSAEFHMKCFVREILKIEKYTSCVWSWILAVCAVILSCLGTNCEKEERAPSDVEGVGKGWLWTTGTEMAKSFHNAALCESELMCEYQCYSPGAHTAAVTSVTQKRDRRKFADHPCSHVICRASLPAGKCPSATKEARHGTCSHGLHPQRCALTPWGVFLMILSPQLLFGQIKPWWLQQKQGEWGHVRVQEELTAFQSHLWALFWVVGGFCSYYGLNTAMVNVLESLHWNTFLSYWK